MRKLNIAAPFCSADEVGPLIDAGADELYCGYLDSEWIRRFSPLEFERKGGEGSNFLGLDLLRKAVRRARRHNVPVALALNGLYVGQQHPLLRKIIGRVEQSGVDAFIVADLGVLLALSEAKTTKRLFISTGGTVFNSAAVSFYEQFRVSRVVLDRQVPLADASRIASLHPGIEFEVFILNTLCVYIYGFCTYLHAYTTNARRQTLKKGKHLEFVTTYDSFSMDACGMDYRVTVLAPPGKRKQDARPRFFKRMVDGAECGVCALYDLVRSPVRTVKIVGRQLDPAVRLKSTRLVRSCLDILEKEPAISRGEYNRRAQELYRSSYGYKKACSGNNCYHPQVLKAS